MVKLTSFMALSTLIIAPTFAAVLPDIETRDVAEPHFFSRDLEGLFAREQDFELPDLARRFFANGDEERIEETAKIEGLAPQHKFTEAELALHKPFRKHIDFLERDPKSEQVLNIRDVIDDDLFERFYDDLD